MSAPTPDKNYITEARETDLLAALKVMLMAWDCKTSVDGRRYIGLGDDCSFPCMSGEIKSVEDARQVLAKAERR